MTTEILTIHIGEGPNGCWNNWCIASDCDGTNHVDTTGASWEEEQPN